jgi:hypothetical protein
MMAWRRSRPRMALADHYHFSLCFWLADRTSIGFALHQKKLQTTENE